MTTMQTARPTAPDCSPTTGTVTIPAGYDFPTLPHLSQARAEGMAWLTGFNFARGNEQMGALLAEVGL